MQYKLGISIALGVFLLSPFHYAAASLLWCDPLLGGCSNPFSGVDQSIQQQQSQTQAQQQSWQQIQDKESALKSQYGYAAYTSCTANMLNIDGGNLTQVTMYLNADEPCMASYKSRQEQTASTQCVSLGNGRYSGNCTCGAGYTFKNNVCTPITCDAGYILRDSTCVLGSQFCASKFGPNSVFNGKLCDCASGYKFNEFFDSRAQCVAVTPAKTTGSRLAANQIAVILSLLQSFGADTKTIASVKAALQ